MAKAKCPVCKAVVPRFEGTEYGWKRLCKRHEDDAYLFPENTTDDEGVFVRGKMQEVFETLTDPLG